MVSPLSVCCSHFEWSKVPPLRGQRERSTEMIYLLILVNGLLIQRYSDSSQNRQRLCSLVQPCQIADPCPAHGTVTKTLRARRRVRLFVSR